MSLIVAAASNAAEPAHVPRGSRPHPSLTLVAHEDIEPDALRSFARPNVTLWLKTRSNTLRDSTLERLAEFDQVYVQVRAPLSATDAAVFRRIPRAGLWIDAREPAALSRQIPGPRRVLVEFAGELSRASVQSITAHRPTVVFWKPPVEVDVDDGQIELLSQLPGRRILQPASGAMPSAQCARVLRHTTLQLPVARSSPQVSSEAPCFASERWEVEVGTAVDTIDALLMARRNGEVVFDLTAPNASIDDLRSTIDHLLGGVDR